MLRHALLSALVLLAAVLRHARAFAPIPAQTFRGAGAFGGARPGTCTAQVRTSPSPAGSRRAECISRFCMASAGGPGEGEEEGGSQGAEARRPRWDRGAAERAGRVGGAGTQGSGSDGGQGSLIGGGNRTGGVGEQRTRSAPPEEEGQVSTRTSSRGYSFSVRPALLPPAPLQIPTTAS